nr:hypothetical protein [Tanacetum cinerariifolium]
MSQHLNSQSGSSSRSRTPRTSKHFFTPCIHYGFNDHLSDDYFNYPICVICGSYDHDTHGHIRVISLRRGIKPRNPKQVTNSYETCGSTVYTITDHNDIEWFRRDSYEKLEPVVTKTDVSSHQHDQTDQNDQNDHLAQNDEIINDDQSEHSNHNNDNHIIDNLPNTEDVQTSEPLSSLAEAAFVLNTIPISTNRFLSIPSMASPAPQDRWSQDKHIKLVNTIGNPRFGMLTRAMAKEPSATSAHECPFVDFLSEEEHKKIKQSKRGISINLEKYVKDLLKKYDINDSSVKTPMALPNNLGPNLNGKAINEALYRANPKESHLIAVKRIFRKSTLGACQLLGGKLVCWSAKKQQYVAMSLAEAKYVAATGCCANILWMKSQPTDYDIIYEKIWDNEDVHDLRFVETKFPTIVFNDTLTSEAALSCEPMIRPFDYDKLNNLYDLFVLQRKKSSEQRYFLERSRWSHTPVNNGNSKESFNKQTSLLEKQMDESIPWIKSVKAL